MRPRQPGNAVPNDAAEIEILHPVTVNVNFIIPRQPLDLLRHTPLRPVLLVEERGDDGDARFR